MLDIGRHHNAWNTDNGTHKVISDSHASKPCHATKSWGGGGGGYNIIMYTILYSDMSGQLKQSWYGMVILGDC